jgi:curved DNA-binding protein CbpA
MDYYAILGVMPTADDVVIRAAYRALAQRYHPDRYRGDAAEATAKMAEINAAYEVLSHPDRRREYDSARDKNGSAEPFSTSETEDKEPSYNPLDADWKVALRFFPDLADIERQLGKLSWRLANAYRATVLERQLFHERAQVANSMESEYLRRYFGPNKDIQEFAKALIYSGNLRGASALNRAICVLGESTYADTIIETIKSEHCSPDFETPRERRQRCDSNHDQEGKFRDSDAVIVAVSFAILLLGFILFVALGSL